MKRRGSGWRQVVAREHGGGGRFRRNVRRESEPRAKKTRTRVWSRPVFSEVQCRQRAPQKRVKTPSPPSNGCQSCAVGRDKTRAEGKSVRVSGNIARNWSGKRVFFSIVRLIFWCWKKKAAFIKSREWCRCYHGASFPKCSVPVSWPLAFARTSWPGCDSRCKAAAGGGVVSGTVTFTQHEGCPYLANTENWKSNKNIKSFLKCF
jgi:hypothetical protein